ncbi:ATP-binding protein [Streptomyces sp. NBC_01476]|uniref:ATP-binding protein n=1 Tax=Streptomyces sp. NBC_01476 TaxID=2903881 RepID=UPI002E33318C|nr:ATP-binding protein [Streptomyces sp. NBC_01476]
MPPDKSPEPIEVLMAVRTIPNATGAPGYSVTMPCSIENAAPVRRFVREVAGAWGLDDLADDTALVVTELVANAAQHTKSPLMRVSITRPDPDLIRVAVTDRSRTFPTMQSSSVTDERGRGLALINALTERWGAETRPWGKQVWGELKGKTSA